MLQVIVRTVRLCSARPRVVVVAAALLGAISAYYAVSHFAITTNVNQLVSSKSPAFARELTFEREFPARDIVAVVQAPTPELATQASERLVHRLSGERDHIRRVWDSQDPKFFSRNALLYLPMNQLIQTTQRLERAEPILAALAADPSLRGILDVLRLVAEAAAAGQIKPDSLDWPLQLANRTLGDLLADRPASFSWQVLVQGRPASPSQLRHFVQVEPILNFAALRPGRAASTTVLRAVAELNLPEDYQAKVRLTGSVPISDEEFSTIRHGAVLNTVVTIAGVLIILWLALRSIRIIAAVSFALMVGLALTCGVGLAMIGSFNLISAAFAVLFVGLGVDFAVQFSVRYRSERHDLGDLHAALLSGASKAGGPLALAAAATALAFFSFIPSQYKGIADLGQIAGVGMLIAFICSLTLVPALLTLLGPPPEPRPMGFSWLAPIDDFLQRHRLPVVFTTLAVALAGSPLLFHIPFDFNPVHLENPRNEAVATYLELKKTPEIGANAADVLAPTLADADAVAERLAALTQVAQTLTASTLVPPDQEQKRAVIAGAAAALNGALNPRRTRPQPTDAETIDAIKSTATQLSRRAEEERGRVADDARQLANQLDRLAKADPATRGKAEAAFVPALRIDLANLRSSLHPENVTLDTLPKELLRPWLAPDGTARVEVLPKGNADNPEVLTEFAKAVLAAAPSAIGPAISFNEAGKTVARAFVQAGVLALLGIAVLLWISLRRFGDVLLTLVPLLLAGTLTLELCVLLGLALNFANIIALPLLLGVGVAFKIYYIMAWRAGETRLLESPLTRAVVFSGMTTATAFGSLWSSDSPGMSSMGQLMALSLACTMMAAVLFQPVLMGPPRRRT